MTEPTPDLFDICVVLNEASGAPLGSDLLPFAERVKAIVVASLETETTTPPLIVARDHLREAHKVLTDARDTVEWVDTEQELTALLDDLDQLLLRLRGVGSDRNWKD